MHLFKGSRLAIVRGFIVGGHLPFKPELLEPLTQLFARGLWAEIKAGVKYINTPPADNFTVYDWTHNALINAVPSVIFPHLIDHLVIGTGCCLTIQYHNAKTAMLAPKLTQEMTEFVTASYGAVIESICSRIGFALDTLSTAPFDSDILAVPSELPPGATST